jgi:hypothetical protein
MAKSADTKNAAAGIAALAICEALLLALIDMKLMSTKQVGDVVDDAAAAHRDVEPTQEAPVHREAVAILKRIRSSVQATTQR